MDESDANRDHLLARAGLVEERVRRLVAARRRADPNPDDAFRGLYVSDELVDRLTSGPIIDAVELGEEVASVETQATDLEAAGAQLRLRSLARSAGLNDLDVELLLVALLPDLDSRFERIYGYLNDDVTRRRASVGLALTLVGKSTLSAPTRARLEPSRPLLRHRLVELEDPERPMLTRGLRVPDRVVAHLLGDDAPDVMVAELTEQMVTHTSTESKAITRAVKSGVRVVYVRDSGSGVAAAVGAAGLDDVGLPVVQVDLTRASDHDITSQLASVVREAVLVGGGVVAGPMELLAERTPNAVRGLTAADVPLVLVGTASWNPAWSEEAPLVLSAPSLSAAERLALWTSELAVYDDQSLDPGVLSAQFVLGPAQVRRAVRAAEVVARVKGRQVSVDDLRRGVRGQNAAGLERLARRIEPEVTWDDLVVTEEVLRGLKDVTSRTRHRTTVLKDWGMRRGGGRGCGVVALFAGDSGTGKTMSAEVIAADLQLDLYTVNLATVVDKYVGETEKNLERIFTEAAGVNAVLFFDEADAIFGKRGDVRDAHDRYANIESAYLLQRLESFDGLAILATNLRTNIDDAFIRRIDSIIDFPTPGADIRQMLWSHCLTLPHPIANDLDIPHLADRYDLTGGHIRAAAISAAYASAADGSPVAMLDVVDAIEREFRKLGRLVSLSNDAK